MSIHLYRYSTETDGGGMADGWKLHIELFGLVFGVSVAR